MHHKQLNQGAHFFKAAGISCTEFVNDMVNLTSIHCSINRAVLLHYSATSTRGGAHYGQRAMFH